MSEFNAAHNRIVWCDLPVADLERACAFYRAVLAIQVDAMDAQGMKFALLEHGEGNGGCLVPVAGYAGCESGPLVYLNVEGRIRDAVARVPAAGGAVLEAVHAIGPHGFRAIARDSEGNRIALHSSVDR
jgi:uncharacterized protein